MILIINKRTLIIFIIMIIVLSFLIFKYSLTERSVVTNASQKGYVAIVIDDLGSEENEVEQLSKLDIPITVAIMPFMDYTEIDAEKAYDAGMEIILHLPMEPERGDPKWLSSRAVRSNLSNEEVRELVQDALEQLKYAKGMNNHMGSKIMKDEIILREILQVVKERNIYFLNSRTDESTFAEELCKELDIEYFYRNIFLDNEKSEYYISKAMEELSRVALENGYAVGIGHVGGQGGKITIDTIDKMAKKLEQQGIEFIYLSEMKNILEQYH